MNDTAKRFEQALRDKNSALALSLLEQDASMVHRIHRDMFGRRTSLHMAVEFGDVEVTEKLLALGAKTNVPLHYIDQVHTPASYTRAHFFKDIPNSAKIVDVFAAHYAHQATLPPPKSALDGVRARAASIFSNAAEASKKFFAQDAFGLSSIAAIPAAIAAAIGVGTTATAAAPAIALAAAAGLSAYCMHKLADASLYSGKKELAEGVASRLARAETFYAGAAKSHDLHQTAALSTRPQEFCLRLPIPADTKDRGAYLANLIYRSADAIEKGHWGFSLTSGSNVLGQAGLSLAAPDPATEIVEVRFSRPDAIPGVGATAEWEAARLLRDAADRSQAGELDFSLTDMHGNIVGGQQHRAAVVPTIEVAHSTENRQSATHDGPA